MTCVTVTLTRRALGEVRGFSFCGRACMLRWAVGSSGCVGAVARVRFAEIFGGGGCSLGALSLLEHLEHLECRL